MLSAIKVKTCYCRVLSSYDRGDRRDKPVVLSKRNTPPTGIGTYCPRRSGIVLGLKSQLNYHNSTIWSNYTTTFQPFCRIIYNHISTILTNYTINTTFQPFCRSILP
ncbi:unnamed protein product [Laminaria digitata]